jgi:hypothetical protein
MVAWDGVKPPTRVTHVTGRTYRLTSADIGYKVTVTVSAIDTHGHRASATAPPVGPIGRSARRRRPNRQAADQTRAVHAIDEVSRRVARAGRRFA